MSPGMIASRRGSQGSVTTGDERARRRLEPRHSRSALLVGALLAACLGVSAPARAGGGSFDSMESNDEDSGPPFVGTVKDRSDNPVANAKVTVNVQSMNSKIVIRSDDQGDFVVKGFDKNVDTDSIEFTCEADGYKYFASAKVKTGATAQAPIAVTCIVEKQ